MANAFQPSAREGFATARIDWLNDDILVVLVDGDYEYSASHIFLKDVPGGTRVAVSDPLEGKTAIGGVLDADDVLFPGLAPGDTIRGLWVAQDTGDEATSRLILWFERNAANQLIQVATNGEDITVVWSNAPTRIARI
jgi:hypothetical protein